MYQTLTSFTHAARRSHRLLLLIAVASTPLVASAQRSWTNEDLIRSAPGRTKQEPLGLRPDSILSKRYAGLLFDDTRAILTSPLRWDRQDWLKAGGLTGLVAVSGLLDSGIKTESQETITPQRHAFTKNAQRMGAEGSWLLLGAFETYGYFADDTKAKAVAMDGLSASIISAGIITPALKFAVGRVRPNASDHILDFKPFSGNYSFPSGHVTQAFAVASVISAHYDHWWVKGLSYGLAGAVGYSRIEQNSHYASDVVAGAIIGTVVGRTIVKRHNQPKKRDFTLTPYVGQQGSGLVFSKRF